MRLPPLRPPPKKRKGRPGHHRAGDGNFTNNNGRINGYFMDLMGEFMGNWLSRIKNGNIMKYQQKWDN